MVGNLKVDCSFYKSTTSICGDGSQLPFVDTCNICQITSSNIADQDVQG